MQVKPCHCKCWEVARQAGELDIMLVSLQARERFSTTQVLVPGRACFHTGERTIEIVGGSIYARDMLGGVAAGLSLQELLAQGIAAGTGQQVCQGWV